MKKICVIGSLNVDFSVRVPHFHNPGETVMASSFETFTGGKGGNQAIAAARLGADVQMVAMLGTDSYGDFYRDVLKKHKVQCQHVLTAQKATSGLALIEVNPEGENRIIVVPGANALLTREVIDGMLPELLQYDVYLLQLEIPIDTICYVIKLLHENGKIVVLDPAPVVPLPQSLFSCIDCITPNREELSQLTGMPVTTQEEVKLAAAKLLDWGVKEVVVKLGAEGCLYRDRETVQVCEGFRVDAVDTTAAGDSFTAGLAVSMARGSSVSEALVFANAVGAISTTAAGAQNAMPTMGQVLAFLCVNR